MEKETDILEVDRRIQKKFEERHLEIPAKKKRLRELEETLENDRISERVRKNTEGTKRALEGRIKELENRSEHNFYTMESVHLINEYKEILKTPMKISPLGRANRTERKKQKIVREYLKVASKYIDVEDNEASAPKRLKCSNCRGKNFDPIDVNTYICTECFARQSVVKYNSSYNDINRINISNKYTYDPKIHFRDCIKQYQGKQNCTIPEEVYTGLEDQFRRHHLLAGDESTPKEERFKRITKKHVMMFLKELGHSKHYENAILIHHNLTGKKPDDISHLEDKLLDDFDVLIDLYHKRFKNIGRKSFINTQYVLYQLLRRHRHPCKKENFVILKTIDRKTFHDEICKTLFEELGWNHTSLM